MWVTFQWPIRRSAWLPTHPKAFPVRHGLLFLRGVQGLRGLRYGILQFRRATWVRATPILTNLALISKKIYPQPGNQRAGASHSVLRRSIKELSWTSSIQSDFPFYPGQSYQSLLYGKHVGINLRKSSRPQGTAGPHWDFGVWWYHVSCWSSKALVRFSPHSSSGILGVYFWASLVLCTLSLRLAC